MEVHCHRPGIIAVIHQLPGLHYQVVLVPARYVEATGVKTKYRGRDNFKNITIS
jgi:DNA/RNA endonuclease YhcR with UshA esterase domain